jgi:hypothetical protein
MCVQCLWLETPVFWDIMLHHLGWQVLTFWRIIMPSLPRLTQFKNPFAASQTTHPTMQNCITEHCNHHLFIDILCPQNTSYTTSSVKHMNTAAAWKPHLQQLPSKSLTFQNIPNKGLMKQHESTHAEYAITARHFRRLAAFRTNDGLIKTSERTYQLIRNNCDRWQQRFRGLISTYIICCSFPLSPLII